MVIGKGDGLKARKRSGSKKVSMRSIIRGTWLTKADLSKMFQDRGLEHTYPTWRLLYVTLLAMGL
jgi:uncharacterized lipoprotein YddW (UPF0748 family)